MHQLMLFFNNVHQKEKLAIEDMLVLSQNIGMGTGKYSAEARYSLSHVRREHLF